MSLSLTRVLLAFCFTAATTLGVASLAAPAAAKPGYHASKSYKATRAAKTRKHVRHSRTDRHRRARGHYLRTSHRAAVRRSARHQAGFTLAGIFSGHQAARTAKRGHIAERRVARTNARQVSRSVRNAYAARTAYRTGGASFGSSSSLVAEARRYMGTNPTGRSSLWCARFMNMVLQRTGHRGTGSDMARSFANYGRRVSGPRVGAIAVLARGRGGHVGVVSGVDARGNPIIISGNHGRRVGEGVYPRGRVIAYVMP